jgi:aryl-alcohol dehydrogenase-like predicted oxidoreductase
MGAAFGAEAAVRSKGRTSMEHRPLGRTGVSVGKLCLGTMMFGAWGNPDHDDSIRIIHAALDAGINFLDTTVTAPIIGPRTMEHLESQVAAADVVLDAAVLDRIDEIVPPATNLNPGDDGWTNPDLAPVARRR